MNIGLRLYMGFPLQKAFIKGDLSFSQGSV